MHPEKFTVRGRYLLNTELVPAIKLCGSDVLHSTVHMVLFH